MTLVRDAIYSAIILLAFIMALPVMGLFWLLEKLGFFNGLGSG